jgi:hypothetical protein
MLQQQCSSWCWYSWLFVFNVTAVDCCLTAAVLHACRGKWSSASKEEVEAEMAKGTPYCYRFRVPPNKVSRGTAACATGAIIQLEWVVL